MRGAFDIISVVLISGIIISLVGAAYLWSVPLLEKGKSNTLYQTSSAFVLGLNQRIIDIANAGGGEANFEVPQGFLAVIPDDLVDPDNNSILFQITVSQPLALGASKTYLGGASFLDTVNTTGTFGESSPSIITFSLQPLGTGYVGTFQVHFRELVTPSLPVRGFKISLNRGASQKLSGGSKVTIAYDGQEKVGATTYTKIKVTVV